MAVCLLSASTVLVLAGDVSAQSSGMAVPPESQGSCVGQVPIVVGSDAAAQPDIYAAAMLAGVISSKCIVLAGPRGQPMPANQSARLRAANVGGFVVGGIVAVPTHKIDGRSMTRLSGADSWATLRLVSRYAAGDITVGTPTDQERALLQTQEPTASTSAAPDLSTIEGVFAHAAAQRAEIVADLTAKINAGIYGINSVNAVLRGPAGFRVDLSECPSDWSNTAGITDSHVRIGHTTAQSGTLAAYGNMARGWENYFDWINDNDPIMVDGRPRDLTLIIKDDRYVAANTIEFVDELIEAEEVFSILTMGSPNTLATYDKINQECIPHPFVMLSGRPHWGDPVNHPWTTGLQLSYSTESILWGTWIEQNLTDELPVSVAAVVMDNDFGAAYEWAFEAWADASPAVVSEFLPVRHDPAAPTLTDEIATILASGPDVFILMTAGKVCVLAIQEAGQSGLYDNIKAKGGVLITPSVCKGVEAYMKPAGDAADGWWTIGGGLKDAAEPQFVDEPFIQFIGSNLEAAGVDPAASLYADGYTYGYPYGEALRIAADLPGGLSRTNFILAVRSLDINHPMVLDGVRFRLNGNADAYPIEGSGIYRYDADAGSWGRPIHTIDITGQTPDCVHDYGGSYCEG